MQRRTTDPSWQKKDFEAFEKLILSVLPYRPRSAALPDSSQRYWLDSGFIQMMEKTRSSLRENAVARTLEEDKDFQEARKAFMENFESYQDPMAELRFLWLTAQAVAEYNQAKRAGLKGPQFAKRQHRTKARNSAMKLLSLFNEGVRLVSPAEQAMLATLVSRLFEQLHPNQRSPREDQTLPGRNFIKGLTLALISNFKIRDRQLLARILVPLTRLVRHRTTEVNVKRRLNLAVENLREAQIALGAGAGLRLDVQATGTALVPNEAESTLSSAPVPAETPLTQPTAEPVTDKLQKATNSAD